MAGLWVLRPLYCSVRALCDVRYSLGDAMRCAVLRPGSTGRVLRWVTWPWFLMILCTEADRPYCPMARLYHTVLWPGYTILRAELNKSLFSMRCADLMMWRVRVGRGRV
eukprot:1159092-Rhodomonas_salina.1